MSHCSQGDLDTFLAALEDVVAGGTVLDPQVVAQLFARRRADDPVRRLTGREREVLGLIAEGHSNTAIAKILVVTPGAVEMRYLPQNTSGTAAQPLLTGWSLVTNTSIGFNNSCGGIGNT